MLCGFFLIAVGQATAYAVQSLQYQSVGAIPANWNYHGCWTDQGDRQLGGASYAGAAMTPASCINFCESKGYQFAGVEYARECFCGHQLRSKSIQKPDSECSMSCTGDSSLKCGGPDRLNVYKSSATPVTTNPGPLGSGWQYLSCYEDSVYGRTLSVRIDTPTPNNVESCTSACKKAGYKYAGVEWSSECFCDNEIRYARTGGFNDCDMVCSGNPKEYCGGSQRLNLYQLTAVVTSSSNPSPTTTSISSTSSALAPSSSSSSLSTTTSVTSTTTSLASSSTISSTLSTSSGSSSTATTSSPSPTTTSSSSTTVSSTNLASSSTISTTSSASPTTTSTMLSSTTMTTTTTSTTTTTTTSLEPIVTEFRLQASTANVNVNGKYLKWIISNAPSLAYFEATDPSYKDAFVSIEAVTGRLKVGNHYLAVAGGLVGTMIDPNALTADRFIICLSPMRLGQPLSCVYGAEQLSGEFRTLQSGGFNVPVFLNQPEDAMSGRVKLDLIPTL